MADSAHRLTDEKLEEMEKRLSAIYSRARKELQEKSDAYFLRFHKQDEAKRKLVEKGKLTEEEYKRWRKGKIMYSKRFTDLKRQMASELLHVNETAAAYINGELPEVYALNYNAFENQAEEIGGYSFTLVDRDTVRNLALEDGSLLPYKEIDPAKDIPWNMKNINAEVLQGILQGESMGDIAKRIGNVQEMNKNAAIRTARTMVTGAENRGRQDSYARAESDGIMLEKEWVATFDYRTRHAHALLDGQTQDVDKPFKSELGDIMFPGDPAAAGANVYNCRCTMVSHVVGFNGKKLYDNHAADRETVADWVKKEKEKDPEGLKSLKENGIINKKAETISTTQKSNKNKEKSPVNIVLGTDNFSESDKIRLLRNEKINNGNRYETAYVYGTDGKEKFKVKGTANEVKFTAQQIKAMKGCVITHNHPGNSGFSSDDIFMLKKTGAEEIRASTRIGTYVLQKPKKWAQDIGSFEKIDKIYNSMVDDYILRYKDKAVQEGKHALTYLQNAEEDATRAFAEKFGMSFKFEKYSDFDLQYKMK